MRTLIKRIKRWFAFRRLSSPHRMAVALLAGVDSWEYRQLNAFETEILRALAVRCAAAQIEANGGVIVKGDNSCVS